MKKPGSWLKNLTNFENIFHSTNFCCRKQLYEQKFFSYLLSEVIQSTTDAKFLRIVLLQNFFKAALLQHPPISKNTSSLVLFESEKNQHLNTIQKDCVPIQSYSWKSINATITAGWDDGGY